MLDRGISVACGADRLHFTDVVMAGTPWQFPDQMLKVLAEEFPDKRFIRLDSWREALGKEAAPQLVVLHAGLLGDRREFRDMARAIADTRLAIACSDAAELQFAARCILGLRPISMLKINTPLDIWLTVFRLLLRGQYFIPAEIALGWQADTAAKPAQPSRRGGEAEARGDAWLTAREREILEMITRGMRNKDMAFELGLSEHTVKLHAHNLFRKIGVRNRAGAASWYHSMRQKTA